MGTSDSNRKAKFLRSQSAEESGSQTIYGKRLSGVMGRVLAIRKRSEQPLTKVRGF